VKAKLRSSKNFVTLHLQTLSPKSSSNRLPLPSLTLTNMLTRKTETSLKVKCTWTSSTRETSELLHL
jgi:hypothetical protein